MSCSLTILPARTRLCSRRGETSSATTSSAACKKRQRNDLPHRITDQRLRRRRHRFDVLDVEGADHADSVLFERERVLPALGVRRVAEVVVRELVEHDDVGLLAQRGFVIEVLEDAVADRDVARRHARQARRGDASRSGRPFVSIQPITTRLPSAVRRRASSRSRRVLPEPGALAT